jgi:hypothetical protein
MWMVEAGGAFGLCLGRERGRADLRVAHWGRAEVVYFLSDQRKTMPALTMRLFW